MDRSIAKLLIDGKQVDASTGEQYKLVEPSTGKVWYEVSAASAVDVDLAAQSADRAFRDRSWRKLNSGDRASILYKLANLIRRDSEALAQIESRNVGKPIREARDEVALAANCFEYYAGAINKFGGQTIPVAAAGIGMTFREPIGVCGMIAPWNFPIAISAWKIAPALAMGNTVVLKPASQTPLTALKLGDLALEAGIPAGVLNIIPGAGAVAGEALVQHPLVRKISFTGSTEVGIKVMQLAAYDIKRVTLELGGKSANIIFADADCDRAVTAAMWSVLGNTGQDCCARSRLLVQRSIYDNFVQSLTQQFKALKLGDPLDENTEIGSLISRSHRTQVQKYIEIGCAEGANLVYGGHVPTEDRFESGAYLTPAIFADVKPDMRIAQEEIFGPAICVIPFDTEAEAVAIANNSLYGLSGSVWTQDITRAMRVVRAVETGVISVNSGHSVHMEAPFGGMKRSGIGRELGLAALEHYSELKSVFIWTGE